MLADRAKSLSLPNFPWSIALPPETLEQPLIAKSIHTLPESVVAIGRQLPVGRQLLQRVRFQTGVVIFQILKNCGFEHQKSAIDPAFSDLWFFGKFSN